MNKLDTVNTTCPTIEPPPSMTRKIGNTTYDVYVHFSQTSKETMTDKIMRLIRNDVNTNNVS
jgi:hypothetical protein